MCLNLSWQDASLGEACMDQKYKQQEKFSCWKRENLKAGATITARSTLGSVHPPETQWMSHLGLQLHLLCSALPKQEPWESKWHFALVTGHHFSQRHIMWSKYIYWHAKMLIRYFWVNKANYKTAWGTSLVAQWLRIHLPMQGTRVRSLVLEDPTCGRATKPMHRNYWACVLQLLSLCAVTTEARAPRARDPQQEKPPRWEVCAPQRRVAPARRKQKKPAHSNKDPTQPKIKTNNNKIKNKIKRKEKKKHSMGNSLAVQC